MPSSTTIAAILIFVFTLGVSGAYFGGQSNGKKIERAEWLVKENNDLREHRREITRLVTEVATKQKAYNDANNQIASASARMRQSDRLREQADRATAIARASADSLRNYATGTFDLYQQCRTAFGDLALEGARASAAAHALTPK